MLGQSLRKMLDQGKLAELGQFCSLHRMDTNNAPTPSSYAGARRGASWLLGGSSYESLRA